MLRFCLPQAQWRTNVIYHNYFSKQKKSFTFQFCSKRDAFIFNTLNQNEYFGKKNRTISITFEILRKKSTCRSFGGKREKWFINTYSLRWDRIHTKKKRWEQRRWAENKMFRVSSWWSFNGILNFLSDELSLGSAPQDRTLGHHKRSENVWKVSLFGRCPIFLR